MKLSQIARCIKMVGSSSHLSWHLMLGTTIAIGSVPVVMAQDIDYNNARPSEHLHGSLEPGIGGNNHLYPTDTAGNPLDSDNHITINYTDPAQTDPGYVYGGYGENGHADNNTVTLNNGHVQNTITGGSATTTTTGVSASNNQVTINGGEADGIVGGKATGGNGGETKVTHNTVTINGGTITGTNSFFGDVIGGSYEQDSNNAAARVLFTDNKVILNGGIAGTVSGVTTTRVYTDTELIVENNRVEINPGAHITKDVYGVNFPNLWIGIFSANNNSVSVHGSTVDGMVTGFSETNGPSSENKVNNNHVDITDSHIGSVYGVQSVNTVSNGAVNISNSNIDDDVDGVQNYTGDDYTVSATNNAVNINGSTVGGTVYGLEYHAGSSDITTTDNSVNINNSNTGVVYGTFHDIWTNSSGSTILSANNRVDINNSNTQTVYGAWGNGDDIGNDNNHDSIVNINNNHVGLKDSTIDGDVYSGYAKSLATNPVAQVSADSNNIDISGHTTIHGDVYGGFTNTPNNSAVATQTAIDNTVSLSGENITIDGALWGGKGINPNGDITDFNKVMSGNTLNLNRYRGSVAGIHNFENYNWTLPADVHNGDTLISIANGGTAVDLTGTKHHIADMQMSDNRLQVGDTITLIDKTEPTTWNTNGYQIHQGQWVVYDAVLTQTPTGGANDPFVLKIVRNGAGGSAAHLNPQTKAYSEGRMAVLGSLLQAEDLMANGGIDHVRTLIRTDKNTAITPFIITNGSSLRYKTGSHIDNNNLNVASGLATGLTFANGNQATFGAFFEYGKGNYSTYNRFANEATVRGDGDNHYHGGGVFGRVDFAGYNQTNGAYVEGSLRSGRTNSRFSIDAQEGVLNGQGSSYRSQSPYFGGHLAGGYVFHLDSKQSLDTYARYLWLHMKNDKVNINNESLRFGNTNSHRLQLGGRYSYTINDQFTPYFGAAYEYEFDGKAKAKAYEFSLARPELKGSTGIFEAGFRFQPISGNPALNVDVNAQGYVGKRQGGSGNVKVKYQF